MILPVHTVKTYPDLPGSADAGGASPYRRCMPSAPQYPALTRALTTQPPTWRIARAPNTLQRVRDLTPDRLRHAVQILTDTHGAILANPHHEPQISADLHAQARSAAVLIGFMPDAQGQLQLLLTERQAGLRFAGHIAFPGGHRDAEDDSPTTTALREAQEEVGLRAEQANIIGVLPAYFSHAGHCITAVLAELAPDTVLSINADEVARVVHVQSAEIFNPQAYRLRVRSRKPYRANFYWQSGELRIGGPTLSLLIHLFDALNPPA